MKITIFILVLVTFVAIALAAPQDYPAQSGHGGGPGGQMGGQGGQSGQGLSEFVNIL